MKYQILQAKDVEKFFEYNMCFTFEKAKQIFNLEDFEVVYEGELDCGEYSELVSIPDALESLFFTFNMERPEDFKGHSLSVGDIIKLEDDYYFTCGCGFEKIELTK